MEFLIARGFAAREPEQIRRNLDANTTFQSNQRSAVHLNEDFFVYSESAAHRVSDGAIEFDYLFDGHVFYEDLFIHPFLDIQPRDVQSVFRGFRAKEMSKISGVCVIAQINLSANSFTLYCDPLSQYPVVSWEKDGKYVVSNSAILIEKYLENYGYGLTRDPACMLYNAIAVMNLSMTSPFKEVSFQPPRTSLHGCKYLRREHLNSWAYLCEAPTSYKECLEATANSLVRKCRTLLRTMPDSYFLSDLTGGIDSRLLLAALQAAECTDRVDFWCNNRYPHPDGNVADHIIDKFNLRQGTSLLNAVNEDLDDEQAIARGLFRNRGARYKDWSGPGRGYFPEFVKLSGCFGEIGRSNVYANAFNDLTNKKFSQFGHQALHHMEKVGSLHLMTDAARQQLTGPLQKTIDQMHIEGIDRKSMSDMLYLDGRGRYHFGHYFACNSNLFIYPCLIYDLNLVWANTHLTAEQCFAGKAQFDLIRMLSGDELALTPLADKRWDPSIIPAELRRTFEKKEIITRHSERLPAGKNSMTWQRGWEIEQSKIIRRKPRPEWAKGKSEIWARLPGFQELAIKLLNGSSGNELIYDYVDRKKLHDFAHKSPESVRADWHVWSLTAVLAGIMWDLKREDRTPVDVRFEGPYPSNFDS